MLPAAVAGVVAGGSGGVEDADAAQQGQTVLHTLDLTNAAHAAAVDPV